MSHTKLKERIDLLSTIVLGILGIIVLFLVSPDNLLMNPNFQLEIEHKDLLDKVYVINTGWAQAKNVRITILGNDNLVIKETNCLEGFTILPSNDTKKITLQLERMSSNLECSIYFTPSSLVLSQVIVTADDSSVISKKYSSPTEKLSQFTEYVRSLTYIIVILMIIVVMFRYIVQIGQIFDRKKST